MPDYRRLDRAIWRKNWIESAEIVEEVCETRNSKSKQNKKVQKKGTKQWKVQRAQQRSGRSLELKAGLTAKSVFFLWKVGL